MMSSTIVNSAMPDHLSNDGKRRLTRLPEPLTPSAFALMVTIAASCGVIGFPFVNGMSPLQMKPLVKKDLYVAPRRPGTFSPSFCAARSMHCFSAIAGTHTWPPPLVVHLLRQVRMS